MRVALSVLIGFAAAFPSIAAPNSSRQCAPASRSVATAPSLLDTIATPIRAERFAANWARASEDASNSVAMQQFVAPARHLCRDQQLSYVQAAARQRIRWRSDTTQWGRHDYWASAAETLASGYGDEEDVAILKMQALRALGFYPGDLFITLGRDSIGGPMVVLVAKLDSQYFVLDQNGGKPWQVDERRTEFDPSISFGPDRVWLHMRRSYANTAAASTVLAARR